MRVAFVGLAVVALGCGTRTGLREAGGRDLDGGSGGTPRRCWARSFGGNEDDSVGDVVSSPEGDVYVVGSFAETATLPEDAVTSQGRSDGFVASLSADGSPRWVRTFGGEGVDWGTQLEPDPRGGVYVGGRSDAASAFLESFDEDGNVRWSRTWGGGGPGSVGGIATNARGRVYVGGDFEGVIDFGTGPLTSADQAGIFVASLQSDGTVRWVKAYPGAADDFVSDLVVDSSDRLYVTGDFTETLDLGEVQLVSAGSDDVFLIRLDVGGSHVWSRSFGDPASFQTGKAVRVDAAGNVWLVGDFGGSIDFGGGALDVGSLEDMFVAAFAPDGAHLWSVAFGADSSDVANAIAFDPAGNAVVGGLFYGAVDFSGTVRTSRGSEDMVLLGFGADGSLEWSRQYGGDGSDRVTALDFGPGGALLLGGSFERSTEVEGAALESRGGKDGFVARCPP